MLEPAPIYLDNAATSFPKPAVVADAMDRLLRDIALSPGRAAHRFSLEAGRVIFAAREILAQFFHCHDSSRIVFTANVTASLNIGLQGLLRPGDHVITTGMEHNSVMRPLRLLELHRGIRLSFLPTAPSGEVDLAALPKLLRGDTRLIVVNHVSNVTGSMVDLVALGRMKGEALLMVDAAQSAGSREVDVEAMGIDFLAFTGHKSLYGPTGTGGFYLRPGLELPPLMVGGTGSNSEREEQPGFAPDAYEAGTPNTLGIAGLAAGVTFIRETGLASIRRHEELLTNRLLDGLAQIPGLIVHGPGPGRQRGPVVSVRSAAGSVSDLAFVLDRDHGIMVRGGLHCAPAAHRSIATYPEGTLRISPGYFNSEADIDACLTALDRIRD